MFKILNKQKLLNNRQAQEDAFKINTETLNKTNEEISKTQGQVK